MYFTSLKHYISHLNLRKTGGCSLAKKFTSFLNQKKNITMCNSYSNKNVMYVHVCRLHKNNGNYKVVVVVVAPN